MIKKTACSLAILCLAAASAFAQSGPAAPDQVILCDGKGFTGECIPFDVESWMRHKFVPVLSQKGFNDRASSVRVGANVEVRLFQHVDFRGKQSDDLGADVPALDAIGWNDSASSLMVIPRGRSHAGLGVRMRDYKADPASFGIKDKIKWIKFLPLPERLDETEASYSFAGDSINNQFADVWVPDGVAVQVYDGDNFDAGSAEFPGKIKRGHFAGWGEWDRFVLEKYGMNDDVSSVKVRVHAGYQPVPAQQVLVCKHTGWIGPCRLFKIEPGTRHKLVMKLEQFGLAGARSVAVGSGVEAWLFGGKWFDKPKREITQHVESLDIAPVSLVVHPYRGGGAAGVFLDDAFMPAPEVETEWASGEVWGLNDEISRVRVCGPTSVTLFEHRDFKGKSVTIPVAGQAPAPPGECRQFDLKDWGFNDIASSYRALTQPPPVIRVKLAIPDLSKHMGTLIGAAAWNQFAPNLLGGFEIDTNYRGERYKELLLDKPDALLCAQACLDDWPRCAAFTYFKPGFMPGKDPARGYCSLKGKVPPGVPNQPCCISGVIDPAKAQAHVATRRGTAEPPTEPKAKFGTIPGDILPPSGDPTPPPPPPTTYPQVSTESFDAGLSEQWKVYGEGVMVESGMLTCKDTSAVAWSLPLPPEFVLDFNYRHGTGVGAVVLHGQEGPDTPQYRVWFLDDRIQIVRRFGGPQLFVVAESVLAPPLGFVAGQTYAVTIDVKPGGIRVATGGKVRIDYTDPQPLPPGFGALGCGPGQGFGFDDLVFSVTGLAGMPEEEAIPIN